MVKKRKSTFFARVKRFLTIIQDCQFGRPSVADLARACKVSERTIFRDIRNLQSLGIVITRNEQTQRYQITSQVYLPPMELTPEEAFVILTLCQEVGRSRYFPFMDVALETAHKLLGVFPPKIADRLQPMGGLIVLQKEPVNPLDEAKPVFELLKEAIVQHRAVRVWYKSPLDPNEICTLLHPYRILFSRRSWYVIGRASLFRETRTFHLGRIRRAELTENRYQIPRGFSLERYLRNAWSMIPETGRDTNIVIRFSPLVAQNVAEVSWHKTQRIVKNEDGSILFHARVSGLNEVSWWVLGYGKEAEVISPPEFREKIREHALGLYGKYVTEEKSALKPENIASLSRMRHPLDRGAEGMTE